MSFVTERLDAAVEQDIQTRNRDTWSIETMDQAAWASRKLRQAHQEIDEIDAWQTREIDRIKNAAIAERNRIQQSASFFENALAVYLNHLINEGRKTKSLDLPGDRISIRTRADKLEIDDEKAAIEWLKEHGELGAIRIKESIEKRNLLELITRDGTTVVMPDTGEIVPWARLEPQSASVNFKPAADEEGHDAPDE